MKRRGRRRRGTKLTNSGKSLTAFDVWSLARSSLSREKSFVYRGVGARRGWGSSSSSMTRIKATQRAPKSFGLHPSLELKLFTVTWQSVSRWMAQRQIEWDNACPSASAAAAATPRPPYSADARRVKGLTKFCVGGCINNNNNNNNNGKV